MRRLTVVAIGPAPALPDGPQENSMSATHLGSTTLAQVAIVVRDIEAAAKRYSEVLGLPVPNIIVTQPGDEVQMTFRGRPSNAQAKLAFFSLGPVQLELIEPMGGESTWQEALDRNGESVHHLAFWVEGMQRSVDFLREKGIPMVQRGDMGEGQYAYFDAGAPLGVTLELLERKREDRAVA
jgi:methylmalonyl-CoA/ethylmalonyl-CoA epimerase